MVNTFKSCITLRESQPSLTRTAKGVLGDKARALDSIHARSVFMRCTLASATYTYLLDVFSLPDEVSKRPSSTTNLHFFALLCLRCALFKKPFYSILRYANLLQKFCLTLVGVFSIMNFSTYPQRSARNSAHVYGMIAQYISHCS